jgi:hypothetical protein
LAAVTVAALLVALLASLVRLPSGRPPPVVAGPSPEQGDRLISTEATENPTRSRSPGPSFLQYCIRHGSRYSGTIQLCDDAARYNIDQARHSEGLGQIALASGLSSEGNDTQLVLITDAERTSRGLPRLDETVPLDARAISAAYAETDPTGPPDHDWVSNWAGNYRTPLAADYAWMYDDGPGGTNEACTSPSAPGCWEHRDNILSDFGGSMGASEVEVGGMWSAAELLVRS